MASPSLTWTINPERGTIAFGRTIPFAGNTYDLTIAGGDAGESYTAFVMDDTGLKCLAKSVTTGGSTSIAFNSVDVWNAFVREPHEIKTFHCIVRDGSKSVAEGDISVMWNPLWEDTQTGAVYTMRGPKGNTGSTGAKGQAGSDGESAYEIACRNGYSGTEAQWLETLKGSPGSSTMAKCNEDGKWYPFVVTTNEYGNKVIALDQTGQEYDADTSSYVSRTEAQTILGQKTFFVSPLITSAIPANDNSTKAATTAWIRSLINAGISANVTGNLTGSVLVQGLNTLNATEATSATAPTPTAGDNSHNIATTAFVQGEINKEIKIEGSYVDFDCPRSHITRTSNFNGTSVTALRNELNVNDKFNLVPGLSDVTYCNCPVISGYTPKAVIPYFIIARDYAWYGEYPITLTLCTVENINNVWKVTTRFANPGWIDVTGRLLFYVIYKKD